MNAAATRHGDPPRRDAPPASQRPAGSARALPRLALLLLAGAAIPPVQAETLELVTVTAQKREQDPLRAGLSVAVVDAAALESLQVRTADDIAALEPNVSLNKSFGNSNPVLVVRGVGLQDYNVNNSPNVGIYIDEVYLASNALADFAAFDVERVEILKGPQGALWGRNATGGAVSFVTQRPGPGFDARVGLRAANRATTGVEAMVNLPVTRTFALRLAGTAEQREHGPYWSRTLGQHFGEFHREAGRVAFAWTPRDALSIEGRLDVGHYAGDSYPFTHVGVTGPDCPIATAPPGEGLGDERHCTNTSTGYSDPDGDPDRGDWNIVHRTRRSAQMAGLRIEYDFGGTQLTSVSGYSHLAYDRGEDDDTSALPLLQIAYRSRIRSASQEVRWSSTTSGRHSWLIGLQFGRDVHDEHRVATLAGLFPGLLDSASLDYDQRVLSTALFTQSDWQLSARTRLTIGARYTRDRLDFGGGAVAGPGPYVPAFVGLVFPGLPSTVDLDRRYQDLSGRIGLEFEPRERLLLYASLSKGYKPGGVFGGFGLTRDAFTPYGPERLYAVEFGAKWRSVDRTLTATAASFAYDYRDVQAQTLIQASTGALPLLTNVGDARILGVELAARWRAGGLVELAAGGAWLDTALRDDAVTLDSLQRPLSLRGNELPNAPHWSARASITVRTRRAPAGWDLSFTTDATLRAPYALDLANQAHLRQRSATTLLGASFTLTTRDDRWQVQLWGRNLSGERYRLHTISSGIGSDMLMYSEGRSFGLQIDRHWR